jgi:sugar phosphate isomerase/epimerase
MKLQRTRTRRMFLKQSIAAAAAVNTMQSQTQAKTNPTTTKATWVIASRDVHLKETGASSIWEAAKGVGVDGMEVTVQMDGSCPYLFAPEKSYSIATDDDVKRLGDDLAGAGRRITAFCLHNHFDEEPEAELKLVDKTSAVAVTMGVPAVRIDVVPRKIKEEDAFLRFTVDIGRRIIEVTKDSPVHLGVENHGHMTNRPEFLAKMFDGVGSDRFGLTLDTANFYWFGHPLSKLYEVYDRFAARACHTHCKNIRYPADRREEQRPMGWEYGKYTCPVNEGDIDFKRVAAILRKHNYTGDLCIENESLRQIPEAERRGVLKAEAAFLRRIAATV